MTQIIPNSEKQIFLKERGYDIFTLISADGLSSRIIALKEDHEHSDIPDDPCSYKAELVDARIVFNNEFNKSRL